MIFNSIEFLIFLVIVFITYWLIFNQKPIFQNSFLLLCSYVFYGWWDWRFLSLILFSTIVDYYIGIKMASVRKKERKVLLYLSLAVNLGLLGFFKYYNFFISSLQSGLNSINIDIDTWSLNIILPVGISFYTFQTLSYSIDVYNEKIKPTNSFIDFAAFVSFFPQLVAGPIERASNLLPQFQKRRLFNFEQARTGISMIVYGLFKKVVVADRLAIYVNQVYGDIGSYNTISLIIATIFFSFQIYCDFSGYSLIARGTAKLFGLELMLNFNRPYLSTSIPDFWRRWHISLSTWFKDYVYIPLGGNRKGIGRNYINLCIVFLVSGLWHGANWTFVFWGGLHGLFQVGTVFFRKLDKDKKLLKRVPVCISIISVFFLMNFAWIFFRAESIYDAFFYIGRILAFDFNFNLIQVCAEKGPLNLFLSFAVIFLLLVSYILPNDLELNTSIRYISFNVITILIIIILGINGKAEFIYFQF
jgi:D-alanyl-lipoteichoic acid acyltransferase DltB (MBOAT superfamily)